MRSYYHLLILDAFQIMTAPIILHVKTESVSTLVLLMTFVLQMQFALFHDTKHYVHAQMDILVHQKYPALYVS